MEIVKVLLAIFLPPVAVLLHNGLGGQFVLNIILTLLGGIPGVIHAQYCILKT